MKTYKLLFLSLLTLGTAYSQEKESVEPKKDSITNKGIYTKWRFDIGAGNSEGSKPYKAGYFSTVNDGKVLGELQLNSFNVGATYNVNKFVGFRLDLSFDRFKNKDTRSLPFETLLYRGSLQTVINMNRVLGGKNDLSRFNTFLHTGLSVGALQTVKTNYNPVVGGADKQLGIIVGITPMYRISDKISLFIDVSYLNNFRQHHTWDGHVSPSDNNLTGRLMSGTFGIAYSFGKKLGSNEDDKILEKLNKVSEIDSVQKRVEKMENMLLDTDKDGVADYLDNENNSLPGVTVDSRGIMVDMNKNGVPDELERYLEKTYNDNSNASTSKRANNGLKKVVGTNNENNGTESNGTLDNGAGNNATGNAENLANNNQSDSSDTIGEEDSVKRSINEGYVTAFFNTNSVNPTSASSDGINYVLTYLRANPSATVDIIGHSDEIGDAGYNEKLSAARAKSIKSILMKSGIDGSRLNIISNGEDKSVNSDSAEARSLARRVTFKIK